MKNHNTNHKLREEIELSLGDLDYTGKKTHFVPQTVKTGSLEQVLKTNNYSFIKWHKEHRLKENFKSTSGFCVDNDNGMTLAEARQRIKKHRLNHAFITTRNHGIKGERFRILLPFSRTVYTLDEYDIIVDYILEKLFPSTDEAVKDGARILYGSPTSALYEAKWDLEDLDVNEILRSARNGQKIGSWPVGFIVEDANGKDLVASQAKSKIPIFCPFHDDATPSAFLEYSTNSRNYFIHCKACNYTYWMQKKDVPIEEQCRPYYSYGTTFYDVGIIGEKFFMEKIGDKVFTMLGAEDSISTKKYKSYLVNDKHIRHLNRVDHLGSIESSASLFRYDAVEGVFEVRYTALPVQIEDNEFIETYLHKTFGDYKKFIKEWLAMYVFTNYQKLPTLVLTGERGTSKSTFAEMVMQIYPSLSRFWHGKEKNFTPEYEMKLLTADESVASNETQYRLLKKISGQEQHVVNNKFDKEYQVKNNLNVIIMSNSKIPIFVESGELPTSERNNQFFVFEMTKLEGDLDNSIKQRLKDRLGNYIRTELKSIYDGVKDRTEYRYGISTPITDVEKALFNLNTSEVEAEVQRAINRLIVKYEENDKELVTYLSAGYLPSMHIEESILPRGITRNDIVRTLKAQGYLVPSKVERPRFEGARYYAYKTTQKLLDSFGLKEPDRKEATQSNTQSGEKQQLELDLKDN